MTDFLYWVLFCVLASFWILALFGELGEAVQGGTMLITAIFTIVSAFIVNFVVGLCAIVFFLLLISQSPPRTNRKTQNPADDFAPIEVVVKKPQNKSNIKKLIG